MTAAKKFLLLQLRPEDETSDNEYEAYVRVGGLDPREVCRVRMEQGDIPRLNPTEYAGIIVGGSPFDLSTPDEDKSDLQKRVEEDFWKLFDVVVPYDIPFLGACSGVGLLGSYCGAIVSKEYTEPVGGVNVTLTDEGEKDPLLAGLPKTFRALVGHKEGCEAVPPGAVLLAFSPTAPVQMFRIRKNVYATQFHPEADADVFKLRIAVYKHHGYFPPEQEEELTRAVEHEDTPIPKKILRRFVERYRS